MLDALKNTMFCICMMKQVLNGDECNRGERSPEVMKTSPLHLFEGEHGISVCQLSAKQGRAPAVHEPAAGREVPGNLHLD